MRVHSTRVISGGSTQSTFADFFDLGLLTWRQIMSLKTFALAAVAAVAVGAPITDRILAPG